MSTEDPTCYFCTALGKLHAYSRAHHGAVSSEQESCGSCAVASIIDAFVGGIFFERGVLVRPLPTCWAHAKELKAAIDGLAAVSGVSSKELLRGAIDVQARSER